MILNLYPDHLERHGTFKNYAEAKDFLFDENKAIGKKFDTNDPNVNRNIFTVIS